MVKKFGKLLVILLAIFGLFQLTALAFPGLKNILNDPAVVNTPMVKGAIDYANQVLPEDRQIQIPEYSQPPTITNIVTQKISQKASEIAAEAVDNVKDSAQDQVCKALIQKITTECQ